MQANKGWPQRGQDAWEQAIIDDPNIAIYPHLGSWFLYRPDHLVIDPDRLAQDDHSTAREILKASGAERLKPRDDAPAERRAAAAAEKLGLELYRAPGDDLPELVTRLRAAAPDVASLNHVQGADPHRMVGTGPATPAPQPNDIPGPDLSIGKGLHLAVIDTGLDDALNLAPVDPSDLEIPDSEPDTVLDPAAGHGTFITGILRRIAPGAKVSVHRALLGPAGVASDLEVAAAILEVDQDVDVLNCSFGCESQGDAPPLVIAKALATLNPKTVVVCAAGNQGEDRPHWPAAFKGVYGVASVHECKSSGDWVATDYTSFGWWVDACAPGSDVHSVFLKFKENAGALRTFEYGALWSGTSFAAPQVVGLIAALASREGISASEAAYRLIDEPSLTRLPGLGTLVLP